MRQTTNFYTKDGMTLQYSKAGEGMPVFVLHGGHSNCEENLGYSELIGQGYCLITPSRAGYGDTSHQLGDTLSAACQAYVALLDHLNLDKVHVIAISAGGPSGIYLASRYPDRVKSLTLQSAVTKEWLTSKDRAYKAAQVMFRPSVEKYTWALIRLMSRLFPKFLFKQMAPSFSTLSYPEVMKQTIDEDIAKFRNMMARQRSRRGFLIDLFQTGIISDLDLQAIQCPTIIFHSKNDRSVPLQHAYHAHTLITDSQLCMLDTWGHLIWLGTGSAEMNSKLLTFLANAGIQNK